jgi:hypothetical protein
MGDTDEVVGVLESPDSRPRHGASSHVLTVSLNKLHERQLVSNSTEQFIRVIKNPHCNIDERMLSVKGIKLTRGTLLTLVEPKRPFHRNVLDAYFAVL